MATDQSEVIEHLTKALEKVAKDAEYAVRLEGNRGSAATSALDRIALDAHAALVNVPKAKAKPFGKSPRPGK